MKWLLLLTILSGYSGSSTVAANFDSKTSAGRALTRLCSQSRSLVGKPGFIAGLLLFRAFRLGQRKAQ